MSLNRSIDRLRWLWGAKSTTQHVRALFWLLSVLDGLRVIPAILRPGEVGGVPTAASLAACGLLTIASTIGWWSQRFPAWTIVLDGALLFLIGAGTDDVTAPLNVAMVTLLMRSLYGGFGFALLRAGLIAAVMILLIELTTPAASVADVMSEHVPQLIIMTIIIRILAACLKRLESTLTVSATLAETATELLVADRPQRVEEVAVAAVTTLAPQAQLSLIPAGPAPKPPGAPDDPCTIVLPLGDGAAQVSSLVVQSPAPLAASTQLSLRAISAQATKALESITLRAALHHRAFHDTLTHLPNRALFTESLLRALTGDDGFAGVVFIDLDDFKLVNDTLGHAAGDQLLVAFADRLRGCARSTDVPARLAGDEFALLVRGITTGAEMSAVAARLSDQMKTPIDLAGQEYRIKCSIGTSATNDIDAEIVAPQARAEELIRMADQAMYDAKAAGKGVYRSYTRPSLHA